MFRFPSPHLPVVFFFEKVAKKKDVKTAVTEIPWSRLTWNYLFVSLSIFLLFAFVLFLTARPSDSLLRERGRWETNHFMGMASSLLKFLRLWPCVSILGLFSLFWCFSTIFFFCISIKILWHGVSRKLIENVINTSYKYKTSQQEEITKTQYVINLILLISDFCTLQCFTDIVKELISENLVIHFTMHTTPK